MRLFKLMTILSLAASFAFIAPLAYGAAVTGTVKGPDGTPFKGAFVEAQNKKTRITVNVLSDKDGHYHVDDLAAGDKQSRAGAAIPDGGALGVAAAGHLAPARGGLSFGG